MMIPTGVGQLSETWSDNCLSSRPCLISHEANEDPPIGPSLTIESPLPVAEMDMAYMGLGT